jgi:Transposase DDE domain
VPNLITNVATTDATVPDVAMTDPIHQMLDRRHLLPDEHYLDSGYPSADLITSSQADYGITLVTPLQGDKSPQAKAGAGYDHTSFAIDFDRQQVICPQGHTSSSWSPSTQRGVDTITIKFPTATCRTCPVRDQCTTSTRQRRQLTIRPRAVQQALTTARDQQSSTSWQTKYALRAGVEGTIGQAVAVCDTPPRPLPWPAQSPPSTSVLRSRPQPDPPEYLVERPPHGPHPHQPPKPARTHPRSMIRN